MAIDFTLPETTEQTRPSPTSFGGAMNSMLGIPQIPPIPDDGLVGDTAAEPGADAEQPAKRTLEDVLRENPHLAAEIKSRYVEPEVSRTRADMQREMATQTELAATSSLRARRDQLSDALAAETNDARLKQLQSEYREVNQQLTSRQTAETERQRRERSYAVNALQQLFGLTNEQIAGLPQFQSYEEMRSWALTQSPVVQSAIVDAMKNARTDQTTQAAATQAASFGQRLSQTPAPNFGTQAAATPRNSRTFAQIETDYLAGKVSYKDYAQARANNPAMSVRI